MVYCQSSHEILGYDPLRGPNSGPSGPAVVQNHGAVGNPVAAAAGVQGGNSGIMYDYHLYEGPPLGGTGPNVNQQHVLNNGVGAPQFNPGGSSGNVQGNNAAQANPQAGDSSQGVDGGAAVGAPNIIPGPGDSSADVDGGNQVNYQGYIPPQSAGGAQRGAQGYIPPQSAGGAAAAGDSSNSVDGAGGAPNAAPVAGGADAGLILQRQDLKEASVMSGAAVAGVVGGVVAIGAIGTAVAVVAIKSAASPSSPA